MTADHDIATQPFNRCHAQAKLTAELLTKIPHLMVHYDVLKQDITVFGW